MTLESHMTLRPRAVAAFATWLVTDCHHRTPAHDHGSRCLHRTAARERADGKETEPPLHPRLMTPYDTHYGLAQAKWEQRAELLRAAYAAHPERFPHGIPLPPPLPTAAWINKPLGLDVALKAPTDQVAQATSPAGIAAPDGGG